MQLNLEEKKEKNFQAKKLTKQLKILYSKLAEVLKVDVFFI